MQSAIHRLARINYLIRTAAFGYCFVVIGAHGWERALGPIFWTLLAFQFLLYPHLAWLHTRSAGDSKRAEEVNLLYDSGMLGAWVAALHFPTWITYAALFSTSLNAVVLGGVIGGMWAAGCFGVGAALWIAGAGFRHEAATSDLVTVLCFAGSLGYTCGVGFVVYQQNRRLAAARDSLRASEARYRLIAENAADLIAMVDAAGRWLYTSPSYQRLLEPEELATGADALRRLHPDDAELARVALLRASVTGKPRELTLRLVDRSGRIRQYRTHLQVLGAERPATRLLLVSRDVTDLKDSEERLLVTAHALEGMTEGIMICAADGTVVTVNRAFSEITGYPRADALGQSERAFRNALQPPEYYQDLFATVERDGYWSGTHWARRESGALYREWRSVRAVRDAAGAVTHFVYVFFEVKASGAAESAPGGLRPASG